MKRKVLLRKIILNFCTPSQLEKFDELSKTNVGSACHFALRLIEAYFDRKYTPDAVKTTRETREKTGRTFTVNHGGRSWIQKY